jgi:hypothetical protein
MSAACDKGKLLPTWIAGFPTIVFCLTTVLREFALR